LLLWVFVGEVTLLYRLDLSFLLFLQGFLHIDEHPPDANRGFDLPSALISFPTSGTQRRYRTLDAGSAEHESPFLHTLQVSDLRQELLSNSQHVRLAEVTNFRRCWQSAIYLYFCRTTRFFIIDTELEFASSCSEIIYPNLLLSRMLDPFVYTLKVYLFNWRPLTSVCHTTSSHLHAQFLRCTLVLY
jgi:hypothetical protein